MRIASVVVLVFAAGCAVQTRSTQSPSDLLSKIRRAEAAREPRLDLFEAGIGARQRSVRLATLEALARIEGAGTSSIAAALLGDEDPEVATWAAFALGQIAESSGTAALLEAVEDVSPVPEQVLMALGRAGTATVAREIVRFTYSKKPSTRAAATLAIGLIAKRHPKRVAADVIAPTINRMVRDLDAGVRFGATYALMRLASATAVEGLVRSLSDSEAETRATAVRGLGDAMASPATFDAVMNDPDWRVRVELVRAMAKVSKTDDTMASGAAIRLEALARREFARFKRGANHSGRAMHVLRAVVAAAPKLESASARLLNMLEQMPWNLDGLPETTSRDLAHLRCDIALALDIRDKRVRGVTRCGEPFVKQWRRAQGITKVYAAIADPESVRNLIAMTEHQDPKVRTAAVEALGEIKDQTTTAALVTLLASNDLTLVSAAAELLASDARKELRPPRLVVELRKVLNRLLLQPDASIIVGVLDAMGALGEPGRALLPDLERLANEPRPAVRRRSALARERLTGKVVSIGAPNGPETTKKPAPVARRIIVDISTERGPIAIELFGEVAPHATGTISELAATGYYDGLVFHRIVSDFVAQGGCPRGDGWGGPGYSIPGETSPLPFVRGAVGIATNGRDTGGSQFFIMHSRHPHLEGAYSVVGRVIEGIENVDALQPDDEIISMRPRP